MCLERRQVDSENKELMNGLENVKKNKTTMFPCPWDTLIMPCISLMDRRLKLLIF